MHTKANVADELTAIGEKRNCSLDLSSAVSPNKKISAIDHSATVKSNNSVTTNNNHKKTETNLVLLEDSQTTPTLMVNKFYTSSKPFFKEAINSRVHSGPLFLQGLLHDRVFLLPAA
jgi:hypothetical protein